MARFDRAESCGMDIDAGRLTETLAARLAAIVPDGFHVRAADGMLWYSADQGRFPGQLSYFMWACRARMCKTTSRLTARRLRIRWRA
jgi:hypothetical protein